MRRAFPLLVNIRVAALAGLRLHEIIGGNVIAVCRLRGTRKEFAVWPVAFVIHGRRRNGRVVHAICVIPGDIPYPPCTATIPAVTIKIPANRSACSRPLAPSHPRSFIQADSKQHHSQSANRNVRVQPRLQPVRRAKIDQRDSQHCTRRHQHPADPRQPPVLSRFRETEIQPAQASATRRSRCAIAP